MFAPKNNLIYRHIESPKKTCIFLVPPKNHPQNYHKLRVIFYLKFLCVTFHSAFGWRSWASRSFSSSFPSMEPLPSRSWPGKIVDWPLVDGQLPENGRGLGPPKISIYISNICQTMFKTYNSWSHVIHRWFWIPSIVLYQKKRDFGHILEGVVVSYP